MEKFPNRNRIKVLTSGYAVDKNNSDVDITRNDIPGSFNKF